MRMKTKQYIGLMTIAAAVLTATSCSDFNDYNTAPTDVVSSANQTLWENISQNSDLSDFAALIKKAGFDDELQASHYYTVWAPKNGTYDASTLMQKNDDVLLKEFIKNHIADYNHTISGTIDERIHTLNEKSYDFVGDGTYTFDNVALDQTNLPSSNGVMHVLNGMATFYPNLYEYLGDAEGIDSLRSYFKKYELTTLDESRSVVGPTVNGKQTYIDSVMVTTNEMTKQIRAYLEKEDSSYTMMMPSDAAWIAAYNRIKPYFRYIATTKAQDIKNATSATVAPDITVTVNPTYMADSLAKLSIANNLVFNNNLRYNRWVEDAQAINTDTILTTRGSLLANPQEYLGATREKVKMSNGFARLVDSLAVRSWDAWNPQIYLSSAYYLGHVWTGTSTLQIRTLSTERGDTLIVYRHVQPTSNYSKPEVDMLLDGVLSTSYNIYAVLVPPYDELGSTIDSLSQAKPNQLDFTLSYCNANGALATQKLNQMVVNDPTVIDTVLVGTFTFPVCYKHLGNNVMPNLKITTHFGVFDKTAMATYTRDIRLGEIIMKPVELDQFEANK
ncbi:MAG: fasciclin domain-containing protein [Prevotella sp.]|nr:fasciclin domain-containing protein [Prevotella sp.]